jgi:hypothetical protein
MLTPRKSVIYLDAILYLMGGILGTAHHWVLHGAVEHDHGHRSEFLGARSGAPGFINA